MIMEAVLSIKSPFSWACSVSEKHDVEIKVLDCTPLKNNEVKDLVEIKFHDENVDDVIASIKMCSCVKAVEISSIERERFYAIVSTQDCIGCKLFADKDCFMLSAASTEAGRVNYKIIFADRKVLQELIWDFQNAGAEVQLLKISNINEDEMLTEKQEKIIQVAFERGYYDFPKRIGIKELSEMFSISTATLSEILRRGQRKIIEDYFRQQSRKG
jgi:predicted DNA binding protein